MLTPRLQIQALADRLAGLPTRVSLRYLQDPWRLCWLALDKAEPGQEQDALINALQHLTNREEILHSILAARPGYRAKFSSLSEIASELDPVEWVWPNRIPRGMITILGASQGSGKSILALDWCYRIIHNQGFPDGAPIARPGANVIYVDAEGVPELINQRAEYFKMDRTKLFVMLADEGDMLDLGSANYQDKLAEMATVLEPELIVIDSLSIAHQRGQNNVEDLRQLMGYLIRLARYANCGLVLIHHIRKPPSTPQGMMGFDLGMEDLSGSGFITQQARVVMSLRVVQTGPSFDPDGPRELKVLKNNLGPYPPKLGFTFEKIDPDGVVLNWNKGAPKPYRQLTQMDECKEWLEDILKDTPEGIKVMEVIEAGNETGFNRRMIFRARQELSGHIVNTEGRKSPGNCWKWSEQMVPADEQETVEAE
jgi:KaiC/GvpD/RAD55 family RecA-like ATPase